ncbi:hypothetical protein [Sphingobacterium multivorum]|uniref:hypothetical protein n=1 Tax=Sphingobacterium multivorum TaxID=28454 RepID=UPI00345EB289
MNQLTIAGIYYQFFIQAKDYTLSEVKRKQIAKELIERRPNNINKSKINRSYFLLIYLGLIDRVQINDKLVYRLTQSAIIQGSKRTIQIHYTLPNNDMNCKGLNYNVIDNEVENLTKDIFDPISILKVIPKISDIIKKRFIEVSVRPTFRYLEKWLPQKSSGSWEEAKDFGLMPSLYKVHTVNKEYYNYFFFIKGNFYNFHFNDLVTVQLVQSYLRISNGEMAFNYNDYTEKLNEVYPLLEPIKKVLFTQHILTTGHIPLDYNYQIDSKILKQLKRIYR